MCRCNYEISKSLPPYQNWLATELAIVVLYINLYSNWICSFWIDCRLLPWLLRKGSKFCKLMVAFTFDRITMLRILLLSWSTVVAVSSVLTLWRPLLPYGYSYKASCARLGFTIICNFWHPGTLTLSPESQSAQMSKITNDVIIKSR